MKSTPVSSLSSNPNSVDDGSLEKLAEKAASDHYDSFVKVKWSKAGWIAKLTPFILSALSEATAALEEKLREIKKISLSAQVASSECGTKTNELKYHHNRCPFRIYSEIYAKATTPTPVLQVSEAEELANATTRSPQPSSEVKEPAILTVAMSNEDAWKLGNVARSVAHTREAVGDYIDRGLILRRQLEESGFGIIRLKSDAGVEKVGDKQPRTMAEKKD